MPQRGIVVDYAADRFDDDIALAASNGCTVVRFDVSWRAAQPRPTAIDGSVFENVMTAIASCRQLGIEPWLRLLQPQIPDWFDNDGGFTDPSTAGRWWPRWIELVADQLGGAPAGWVPFEAPFAMARRLLGHDPRRHGELVDTLLVAWRDAWRILRGGPPVATSIDVAVVQPADESPAAADAAQREDHLRWTTWLHGLTTGEVSIPGRADRQLADLAGACDIVGIATRSQAERLLYRTADMAPDFPLALTYKPTGSTEAQRAEDSERMFIQADRAALELDLRWITTIM